jgi:hypothetical protein
MSENQNGSFRRKVNFAAVSNNALKDPRLSLKAKGLYALIQSYITLPELRLTKTFLQKKCKEKDKAFDSAWKELKDCGYLKLYRIPSGKNDAFQYEYDLLDEANAEQSALTTLNKRGEVVLPKPSISHTPQKEGDANTHPHKATESHLPPNGRDANSHTPHFVPYANGTRCVPHPMRNGGDNSNTKSGNTLSGNIPVGNTLSVSLPPDEMDRSTDKTRNSILEQIEYDWIEGYHPDYLQAANALVDCMVEMETTHFTKISGVKQSRYALKKRLDTVSAEDVMSFLDHMRGVQPKNIRNINAYFKSAFINFLVEQDLALSTI